MSLERTRDFKRPGEVLRLRPMSDPRFHCADERGNIIHPGDVGAPLYPGDVVVIKARVLEVGRGGGYARELSTSEGAAVSLLPKTSFVVLDAMSLEVIDFWSSEAERARNERPDGAKPGDVVEVKL